MVNFNTLALCNLLPFLTLVAGQTPSGFEPIVKKPLRLTYGTNFVSPAGMMLPRPVLLNPPKIGMPSNMTSLISKGLLFMIDLDVPRNGSRVSLLHWLATDVDISQNPITIPVSPGGASYLQPSPPSGDIAHRYIFLMFSQPQGFYIPPQYQAINPPQTVAERIGFDLTAFAAATNLGAPLAANYIKVQNIPANATTPNGQGNGNGNGNQPANTLPTIGISPLPLPGQNSSETPSIPESTVSFNPAANPAANPTFIPFQSPVLQTDGSAQLPTPLPPAYANGSSQSNFTSYGPKPPLSTFNPGAGATPSGPEAAPGSPTSSGKPPVQSNSASSLTLSAGWCLLVVAVMSLV